MAEESSLCLRRNSVESKTECPTKEKNHRLLSPRVITKLPPLSGKGGLSCLTLAVEMIMEMLSHHTRPYCISANILTIAELLLPNQVLLIKELPEAVIGQLRLIKFLDGILHEELGKISSIHRVGSKITITQLHSAIEKEFALTANYDKGHH